MKKLMLSGLAASLAQAATGSATFLSDKTEYRFRQDRYMGTIKQQRAFTLLEIMLVISIIVVLLGVAINKLVGNMEVAKGAVVKADIQAIGTQLKLYESMNGYPPPTEQGLQALVTQPSSDPRPQRWHQLLKEIPSDPWSNHYIYLCPGRKNPTSYDLYSAGRDRKADTADDDWGG